MRIEERPQGERFESSSSDDVLAQGPTLGAYSLVVEVVVIGSLMACYRGVRSLLKADLVEAFHNARRIVNLERWLGLTLEAEVQQLILSRRFLVHLVNHYYLWMHFPVVIALLGWVFWRHRDHYTSLRNEMAAVTFLGLVVHIAYPLAPPRMMPGFIDTLSRFGPSIYPESALDGAANQIAAMPSLHFAWALVATSWFSRLLASPLRHLTTAHPILMLVSIIGTANHWWLDAAAAGFLYVAVRLIVPSLSTMITRRRQPCGERY